MSATASVSAPSKAAPSKAAPEKAERKRGASTRLNSLPVTLLLSVLTAINIMGASYYAAPPIARPRHPWHSFLRPSGAVGQTAGILAFVIFIFLWLYPLRKKWKGLAWTGAVARWLDIHVTVALGLPLMLTIHAAWRADGVIGLGFGAMLVVCASGLVGRYLYVRIPRARSGVELTREELANLRASMLGEIAAGLKADVNEVSAALVMPERAPAASVLQVIERLLLDDARRLLRTRQLAKEWGAKPGADRAAIAKVVKLASREMALADQARMLESTQRVFRYWHIAHMPFALTALFAVTIHVVVVIAMGTTWFR